MNRLLQKLLKIFVAISLFFMLIVAVEFAYFYLNKDKIAETLLLSINGKINGEVSFQDIYLEPFVQFPNVSIALKEFAFFENPDSVREIIEDPIADFKKVYLAFDLIDLLNNKITITKVTFEDGFLDLIKYPDKKFNFQNAFLAIKAPVVKKVVVEKKEEKKTTRKPKKRIEKKPLISKTLKLELTKITIRDFHFSYNNQLNGKQSNLYFHNLIASLNIMPDSISSKLFLKTEIKKTEISEKLKFSDLDIQFRSEIKYNRDDSVLEISSSKLLLARAVFRVDGLIDLKGDGKIDLNINASDKKLGFLSLLLTKSGIENLKTGNLFFKGSLNGTLKDEIPELFLEYGIEDLSLKIPGTEDSIQHLNLKGYFKSGKKEDLSMAVLKIDSLKADLPEGFIDAVFEMKNFATPLVKYRLDLMTNITGMENVFRQRNIDSLKGKIVLHNEFKGVLYPGKMWTNEKKGNFILRFDSVAFNVRNTLNVNYLNGVITNKKNRIQLKKIKLISGNTDLLIDGDIQNLSNILYDEGKNIIANLSVKAGLVDLPKLLPADSLTGKTFPYQIKKLNLKFRAISTRADLLEFNKVPRVQFTIKSLDASIDSFLKPLNVKKGKFVMSDKNERLLLDFRDFDIKIAESRFLSDFKYYHQKGMVPQIKARVKTARLNIGQLFFPGLIDSASLLNTFISGAINMDIRFSKDEKKKFGRIELTADSLSYWGYKNAIRFKGLRVYASGVSYSTDVDKNPLATLSGKFELSTKKLKSKYYELADVAYKTDAENGIYTISPENDQWFGTKANGKYVIAPFENPPSYSFDYSVKQFSAGRLFANFLEDSVLTGKMDLALRLSFKGNNQDSIVKTMKGKIRVQGSNLNLYGLNIDEFLKKFQTTNELNLMDIGVAVYAGPIALLATKKTNFARIKVTDRHKQSQITDMVSDWKIKNDSLIADDVAFTTKKNRIALKGWYSYNSDSLDFSIGLLNPKGCTLLKQNFAGWADKPEISGIDLFGNFNELTPEEQKKSKVSDCKPFYKGSLKHPVDNKIKTP